MTSLLVPSVTNSECPLSPPGGVQHLNYHHYKERQVYVRSAHCFAETFIITNIISVKCAFVCNTNIMTGYYS